MGLWKEKLMRVAWSGVVLFAVSGLVVSAEARQSGIAGSGGSDHSTPALASGLDQNSQTVELPDSPGATSATLQPSSLPPNGSQQGSGASAATQPQAQPSQAQPVQSSQAPTQQTPLQQTQRPEGTAAAEPIHANGIAASQPAGVAIAPVKQRRVRTIVIRVGAIVGAAVAVGAVVALTEGTSSRPPGAR